eukprot:PLAT1524.1.p1 GENE.PLAT1524.1~~PLAT1524.1.p1  ORF type:complete len:309 (+),score=129.01 PLAT1524.1:46-927(+)
MLRCTNYLRQPAVRCGLARGLSSFRATAVLAKPGEHVRHPRSEEKKLAAAAAASSGDYLLPHPIWSKEEVEAVSVTHTPPEGFRDKAAYATVRAMKTCFDVASGFAFGRRDERTWLTRIIFLEAVAGVPGMVAAMTRHLHSLRRLKRDAGWIHTLLEEAENERMHLLVALTLRQPGPLFRYSVVAAQGVFVGAFSLAYLLSPKFCHRFVGYLEETAVQTYSTCLDDIDSGRLPMWSKMAAPELARKYWQLGDDAQMRDVVLAIRADESNHRDVNHTFAQLQPDEPNPFGPGSH